MEDFEGERMRGRKRGIVAVLMAWAFIGFGFIRPLEFFIAVMIFAFLAFSYALYCLVSELEKW